MSAVLREARDARNEAKLYPDELNEVFEFMKTSDANCKDVIAWWRSMAGRFPHVSRCARDVFMITGSYVAFESAFYDREY